MDHPEPPESDKPERQWLDYATPLKQDRRYPVIEFVVGIAFGVLMLVVCVAGTTLGAGVGMYMLVGIVLIYWRESRLFGAGYFFVIPLSVLLIVSICGV